MKSLYVTDLDGTLLLDDASLSQYSRRMLLKLLDAGVELTFASARSVVTMRQILGDLPLKLPVIEFNGAMASDYHTGEHLLVTAIDAGVVRQVYDLVLQRDVTPFISSIDNGNDRLYWSGVYNEGMQWYMDNRRQANDPRIRFAEDLGDKLDGQIVCITVVEREDVIRKIHSELSSRFNGQTQSVAYENQYSPGWWWLTIHAGDASKGKTVRRVFAMCDISDRRLVVFGDQINDVDMFRHADHSVAVGNAIDQLSEMADERIGTNREDAVVNYILKNEGLS